MAENIRAEIVSIVSAFIKNNELDYRETWRAIYRHYEEAYNIPVTIWYKFGTKDKLTFLEDYEDLYGTITKLKEIIKELK